MMSKTGYIKKATQRKKEEAIKAIGKAIREGCFGKAEFVTLVLWILQLADQNFIHSCESDLLHRLTNVRRWRDGEQMPISDSQIGDAILNCGKQGLSHFCLEIWKQVTENLEDEAIQLDLSDPIDELATIKERVGNLEIVRDSVHDWIDKQASLRGIMQQKIHFTEERLDIAQKEIETLSHTVLYVSDTVASLMDTLNTAFPMLQLDAKHPDDIPTEK